MSSSFEKFQRLSRKLIKRYHPDNQETGNNDKFLHLMKMLDEVKECRKWDKLKEIENYNITLTEAYNGTIINCNDYNIQIPPKYYNKNHVIKDNNGDSHYIRIKIKENDKKEHISYEGKDGNLILTYDIVINIFDIILGCKKTLDIFGENVIITLEPYEFFKLKNGKKQLKNKGYPLRNNRNKRNDLYIQFKIYALPFTNEEQNIIEALRKKYGN